MNDTMTIYLVMENGEIQESFKQKIDAERAMRELSEMDYEKGEKRFYYIRELEVYTTYPL